MEPRFWDRFQPATVKYRENNLQAWVRQPANAWSNLAYVAVGIWLCYRFWSGSPSRWLLIVPATAVAIGVTSFMYHASYSLLFQLSDLASMYLLSGFVVTFSISTFVTMPGGLVYLVLLLVFAASVGLFVLLRKRAGFLIFGFQVLVSIALEAAAWIVDKPGQRLHYALGVAVFAVAWVFWIADYTGRFSDPDNHVVQGHALWHVVSSLCFVFLYNYYAQFTV